VPWDTSEHGWLEGRGERLYWIHMIDDATSELTARFVRHDSTEENMRLLWHYVERHGRPVAFYTDKATLFQTAPKVTRNAQALPRALLSVALAMEGRAGDGLRDLAGEFLVGVAGSGATFPRGPG
jgi:hypothetical protein